MLEPQYDVVLEYAKKYGLMSLGLMSSHSWITDPKHLLFVLSRYKFVAKMFQGLDRVLEIGCADAFATRLVAQATGAVTAIDFDPVYIDNARKNSAEPFAFECLVHNILDGPLPDPFDGIYAMDVIEHISPDDELLFMSNMVRSLQPHGVAILGTPSAQSQVYASKISKAGHVNCKDHHQLKRLVKRFFHNVFLFSMNDEIVHTGFYPMAHYFIMLCCGVRNPYVSGED